MKQLLLALPLALCACASSPGNVPMDAPVVRSVERVLDRHDAYVAADSTLSDVDRAAHLADSSGARTIVVTLSEVSGAGLSAALSPSMARHDAYVLVDADLEQIERDTYLESTRRLRSLFAAVQ